MRDDSFRKRLKRREDMFLRRLFGILAKMAKADGKVDAWEVHAAEGAFARFPRAAARRTFCRGVFNTAKSSRACGRLLSTALPSTNFSGTSPVRKASSIPRTRRPFARYAHRSSCRRNTSRYSTAGAAPPSVKSRLTGRLARMAGRAGVFAEEEDAESVLVSSRCSRTRQGRESLD